FLTAIKFLNTLIKNGIEIQRASSSFQLNGTRYPEGSYVIKTNQAYRPHILDMFEAQDHPDDFAYPGAPPTRPYDNTGWTLSYTRCHYLVGFLAPWIAQAKTRTKKEKTPAAGKITKATSPAGYLLSHEVNDSFVAVNRLLNSNEDVYWVKNAFTANNKQWP